MRDARRAALLAAAVPLLLLAPFLWKPFHMDDPLFVACARQIVHAPADPYGMDVNWFGTPMPMAFVMRNPLLFPYLLALGCGLFGGSELALHACCLPAAAAAAAGTRCLAGLLGLNGWVAVLLLISGPGFLACATAVTPDMTLLAFWVWSLFFWVRGVRADCRRDLWLAALLAAAAALTKFNGLLLVPLLAWLGALQYRRGGRWLVPLALPPAAAGLCVLALARMYGAPFLDGLRIAGTPSAGVRWTTPLVAALFAGGILLNHAPVLVDAVRRRSVAHLGGCVGAAFILLGLMPRPVTVSGAPTMLLFFLTIALLVTGVLQAGRAAETRPASQVLVPWMLLVFLFAFLGTWTISVRYLLPLLPAAALLAAATVPATASRRRLGLLLLPGVVLALLVAHADLALAVAQREAARQLVGRHPPGGGRDLWFQGHWGFQWYMEQGGARALDLRSPHLEAGDVIVVPANNTNTRPLVGGTAELMEELAIRVHTPITLLARARDAGFHSSIWGRLPYAPGAPPEERFAVYRAVASAASSSSSRMPRTP